MFKLQLNEFMAFCGFLRESPQITHPSLSRDLCRDRFLPQTWTLNSGFVLLLLQIFPGAAMPRCCEATVLIKRVGISTHTHTRAASLPRRVISAGIKAQMSSRSAQAKSEALTVIGVELADREDWRLSPSPPPSSVLRGDEQLAAV